MVDRAAINISLLAGWSTVLKEKTLLFLLPGILFRLLTNVPVGHGSLII